MIINKMIQRVQSLYSKGVQSDDTRLSKRHIYSKLITSRAKLFTQKLNKRQKISQWNWQTLNCVELIKAEPYECPCLPSIGCVILRTKEPLPKPLTGILDGHAIQSVTSLEGSILFSETTWEDKKYKKGSKYTANKPDFYIRDNYLFITTKKGPKAITITGLFDDPLVADTYPRICGDSKCEESTPENICPECESPLDKDFPIDNEMAETIVDMAVQELIGVFNQGREDVSNNTRDTLKEESK